MALTDLRKIFKNRVVVFSEGDSGDVAYLIRSGSVALVKRTQDGPVTLATIGKNSVFGEMALLDGAPRMASAVAVGDTICSVIDREQFEGKLHELNAGARGMFEELLRYVRGTLPWEHRKAIPELAVETPADQRIRPALPPPGAPIPPDILDPALIAIYGILISYVRRRLPDQPPS